jgi:hypothetical protein
MAHFGMLSVKMVASNLDLSRKNLHESFQFLKNEEHALEVKKTNHRNKPIEKPIESTEAPFLSSRRRRCRILLFHRSPPPITAESSSSFPYSAITLAVIAAAAPPLVLICSGPRVRLPMATDRLLQLLRAPATSSSPAAGRSVPSPHRLRVPQAASGMRRASVACSSSGGAGVMTYKDAGVDIDAGTELVRRIAKMAPGIGGFGGLFPWGKVPPPLFFL